MSVWALLVAAGTGERLGEERPKAFVGLGELPLLAEPCGASTTPTGSTRSSSPPRPAGRSRRSCSPRSSARRRSSRRSRAARRAPSRSGAALAEVPDDALVVLVHDAARPLVDDDVIERVLAPLSEGWDGVVPGSADRRHGQDGRRRPWSSAPSPRSSSSPCRRRRRSSPRRSGARTPASSAVRRTARRSSRRAGGRVTWVEGDPRLLKVTTTADLELVAAWL